MKRDINITGAIGGIFGLLIVALVIFIGPALLVWGLGAIMQGEGYDLNFWSWLGGLAVIAVLGGASRS